jgi:hypothetical protein
METLLTCCVPNIDGTKEIVVGSKISQGLKDLFEELAKTHDRTPSYLLRELAIRGLAQYYLDGNLKASPEEEAIISRGHVQERKKAESNTIKVRNKGKIKV